jgi:hypothetical protein
VSQPRPAAARRCEPAAARRRQPTAALATARQAGSGPGAPRCAPPARPGRAGPGRAAPPPRSSSSRARRARSLAAPLAPSGAGPSGPPDLVRPTRTWPGPPGSDRTPYSRTRTRSDRLGPGLARALRLGPSRSARQRRRAPRTSSPASVPRLLGRLTCSESEAGHSFSVFFRSFAYYLRNDAKRVPG